MCISKSKMYMHIGHLYLQFRENSEISERYVRILNPILMLKFMRPNIGGSFYSDYNVQSIIIMERYSYFLNTSKV